MLQANSWHSDSTGPQWVQRLFMFKDSFTVITTTNYYHCTIGSDYRVFLPRPRQWVFLPEQQCVKCTSPIRLHTGHQIPNSPMQCWIFFSLEEPSKTSRNLVLSLSETPIPPLAKIVAERVSHVMKFLTPGLFQQSSYIHGCICVHKVTYCTCNRMSK